MPAAPPRHGHFPDLDGLRGVAILLVLVVHTIAPEPTSLPSRLLRSIASSCWVGVNLFFVLSGFLIVGILLDAKGQPGYFSSFYARRTLRIFPLYFAFLGLMLCLLPWLGVSLFLNPSNDIAPHWIYWLYLTNFWEGSQIPVVLRPLWSLAVEEQVYLVIPAVIAVCPSRVLPAVFMALMGVAASWRFWAIIGPHSVRLAYTATPACLDAFAVGGIVAVAMRSSRGRNLLRRLSLPVWALSGFTVLAITVSVGSFNFWDNPARILTLGLSAITCFFGAGIALLINGLSWPSTHKVLRSPILGAFGRYSYAIYVVHTAVVTLIEPAIETYLRGIPASVALFTSVTAISFVIAAVSWKCFESPILSLKRFVPMPRGEQRLIDNEDNLPRALRSLATHD